MRWRRSSQGSLRFNWFGRWRRKTGYEDDDESEEERAPRKGGKFFTFLVRRRKEVPVERQTQLTASEEDLEAWMQMRKDRPRIRNTLEGRTRSSECVAERREEALKVMLNSTHGEKGNGHRELASRASEEDIAWKTRLLRQEGDIETLKNTISNLRSQLGKKSHECLELRKELDKVDSLKKGGKNRSSIISQDESFQTVIFPMQSGKRASIRRRVDSAPVSYSSLRKRTTSTQTETAEGAVGSCGNENCRLQILKMKRESNALKMQMADSEDIILGLELDHDALRKYLTQTELKVQKSDEEIEAMKKNIQEQERHYKCIIAGYDDRLNSLKGQNDKLSSKLFALINRRSRLPSEDKSEKKEVGIQAITQLTLMDNPTLGAEAIYYGQAVKPRKGRYSTGQIAYLTKNEKERLWGKRYQNTNNKLQKNIQTNNYTIRDVACEHEGSPNQQCPSSDNSLEHEIIRRNKNGRRVDAFEREDSGLETDRSYISADNEHDRVRLMSRKMVAAEFHHSENRGDIEANQAINQRQRRCDIRSSKQDQEKFSNWKQDIMSQLNHLDYVIEKHHGGDSRPCDKSNEKRRSILDARAFPPPLPNGSRQSWHEPSHRQQEMVNGVYIRQQGKSSISSSSRHYGSTEITEGENGDIFYFR